MGSAIRYFRCRRRLALPEGHTQTRRVFHVCSLLLLLLLLSVLSCCSGLFTVWQSS